MAFPSIPAKYGLCTFVFVSLLLLPPFLSWMSSLLAPNQVVLDLGGLELPALYKRAVRYSDGSIDLTINIPASADVIKRLIGRQHDIKYDLAADANASHGPGGGYREGGNGNGSVQTYYPVTMDSPYVINSPHACEGVAPLHVLVIVHTATANFQRRRLIRETWASKHLMTTRNQRLVFLLGLTTDSNTQMQIENERVVYKDLIQGRFKDTYHNLTHKGVLAYRWISHFCPNAQLILKVDDDVFINPFLFYENYFPRFSAMNRTLACHFRPKGTSAIFRDKGKWKVEKYQFRGFTSFPVPYCNGYMVIITPDIVKGMYRAAYTTPFFWVDDVYLYGMLPAKVGKVKFVDLRYNLSLDANGGLKCYKQQKGCHLLAANAHSEVTFNELWRLALSHISNAIRRQINPAYLVT